MALITTCKACRKRLKDALPCPCGSTVRRFVIDYWPNGRHGKRVRMPLPGSIQDISVAAAIERDLRKAASEPEEIQANPENVTVADLFDDYLKWYGLHRAESSKIDVLSVWNNHLKPIFGGIYIASINRNHFTAYQQARKASNVTNRTINKEIEYFRGFLRWCRMEKQMDLARKSEALNLRWGDIDTANKQIRVQQKGGSFKILPASDWLFESIKRITPENARATDYVFVSKWTGKPLQNLRKAIERACKKAKVTKYVHAHLFRHSIAVHFMADGVNQRMIQRFMGHGDSKSTEFYTTVSTAHLRGMADRFDRVSISQTAEITSK